MVRWLDRLDRRRWYIGVQNEDSIADTSTGGGVFCKSLIEQSIICVRNCCPSIILPKVVKDSSDNNKNLHEQLRPTSHVSARSNRHRPIITATHSQSRSSIIFRGNSIIFINRHSQPPNRHLSHRSPSNMGEHCSGNILLDLRRAVPDHPTTNPSKTRLVSNPARRSTNGLPSISNNQRIRFFFSKPTTWQQQRRDTSDLATVTLHISPFDQYPRAYRLNLR